MSKSCGSMIEGVRRVRASAGFAWIFVAAAAALPACAGEVTIYRDEFGTPHIYGSTADDACFGMGYAQAEDRLEEVLRQYRRAAGTMSEVFGAENGNLQSDYRQRLWRHA